jgi:hypothetical protein
VAATNLTLEGGGDGAGVLTRVGLDDGVGVRWFLVDVSGDAAVGEACEVNV